jgi:hypothetical protein
MVNSNSNKLHKDLKLAPAEQEFADVLHNIADTYGKLSDYDENGIWVGYVRASQNDNLKRGVACVNCFHYDSENKECHIVKVQIEPGGYCRLAAIYPGLVKK